MSKTLSSSPSKFGGPSSVGERPGPPKTSATWIVQKGGNDTWFRCDAPAQAVGGKVLYLKGKRFERSISHPNRDTGLPWTLHLQTEDGVVSASSKAEWDALCRRRVRYTEAVPVFPTVEGAVVFTRPDGRRAVLAQYMREQGMLVCAETDDNYLSPGHMNLHQRQSGWTEDAIDITTRSMASFDRNIFSTDWLRDRYHKEMRRRLGKQNLPELFVCRNHIPHSAWPERKPYDGPLRVGFMGSGSHVWDINMAYTALHAAKNYGGATITMIGYNPAEPDKEPDFYEVNGEKIMARSQKSIDYRAKWRQVVDTHIEWIDPGRYRRVPLPLDIGLAPLMGANDFTLGKSDAKALEYTIAGAACVLSTSGIYSAGGWKHEVNCLMAGSQQEMAEQTLRLCLDEKLRYDLVTAAQEMVWNERCEIQMREEWSEALNL